MTTDDDQTEDGPPITWKPVGELPGQLPFDRLDYGDAEQLAEMTTDDGSAVVEESREMVDEPIKLLPPYDRAQKRRNQRPLPT
ncbi:MULTISPECIES: hypothetical protein [Micromonospora]|uniref:Uncharacterized protein n=1 Tax=Micromonospora zamorensis TaxID=709883 RepID=A0ABZ1PE11_9ACTN|nr:MULTISPECIES: hypothetical protein [Micromonospora]MBQ0979342.1 hypothetical protein [Micromonospora sp. M61]MBQ1035571.1 hypothetical protein [Micromonospora sp. C81]TQJ25427.1 hypothetical protein FBZ33_5780 [Micromonospora sp. A202]WSK51494.1 hypothetical protein OG423_14595 [Micromonospora zamorensis]WTE85964.1 hypothetical protein OHA01_25925 [Micromonospora zamorensis]